MVGRHPAGQEGQDDVSPASGGVIAQVSALAVVGEDRLHLAHHRDLVLFIVAQLVCGVVRPVSNLGCLVMCISKGSRITTIKYQTLGY